jgi:hypothetical protein
MNAPEDWLVRIAELAATLPTSNGHDRDGDEPGLSPLERIRSSVITTDQLKALAPPAWLIDGILQADSLAEIYGKPGAYKSFLVADWALSIAHGLGWQGRSVTASPVLYVIAEGAAGMGARIAAWETHNRGRLVDVAAQPVWWLPLAVRLGSPEWGHAIGSFAAELGARLVIFDTRARCTVGLEENAAKDMGLVVANLDTARQACGACMLLVHHAAALNDRSRGSTVIEGAVDTEISIRVAEGIATVRIEKQKAGTSSTEWRFRPTPIDGSIVLTAVAGDDETITPSGYKMLDALREICIDEPVSFTRWRDTVPHIAKATFARQIRPLLDAGLIAKTGKGRAAAYEPAGRLTEPPPDIPDDF